MLVIEVAIFLAIYGIASCEQQSCSAAGSACVLTPEEIEGPYYLPYHLMRTDIREGKPGVRFDLKLIINDVNTCKPLPNVSVDIWHCDELGIYSSYVKIDPNKPPPPSDHIEPTDNSTFMRGVQNTDENGVANFITNFPGWYNGRTIHIHVEVYKPGHSSTFTGQLYFTEQLSAEIAKLNPYVKHNSKRLHNEEDGVFNMANGNKTILPVKPIDEHKLESGIKAEFTLSINPNKKL